MQDRWISDDTANERWPHYTRANAAEVGPAPFSPLGCWIMSGTGIEDLPAAAAAAQERRVHRPALGGLTDAQLVEHARSFFPLIRTLWRMHMQASVGSSIATGAVQQITSAIGKGDDYFSLFAAIGEVVSADASLQLWALSRTARTSPVLAAVLDAGPDAGHGGLAERVRALDPKADDGAVGRFQQGFEAVLAAHGQRGPNEWDLASRPWDVEPDIPLRMIERLRHQGDP